MTRTTILLSLLNLIIIKGCTEKEPNPPAVLPSIEKYNPQTKEELIDNISNYLQEVASGGYSGIVGFEIEGEGQRIFPMGRANASMDVESNTIFPIGSLTKSFLGVATSLAVEQGLLSYNDSLSRFFGNVPADKQAITVHNLLTHTGGFPAIIGPDEERIERDEFVSKALETNLVASPGSQFIYSNVGYSLIAAIIEMATGIPHLDYLREGVLAPAGIELVDYNLSETEMDRLAHGYDRGQPWGTHFDRPRLADGPGWNLRGNGGLFATVPDVFLWKEALENGLIISEQVLDAVTQEYVVQGGGSSLSYGYGWDVGETSRNTKVLNHDGGNGVYYARITWWMDEGVFLFTASNDNQQPFEQLPSDLNTLIIRFLNN